MSLDGYICGPNENIEGYVDKGSGLDQYMNDLQSFDTVIMGRKTYEFGFKFGIVPGQPAYHHMKHYIFSSSAAYEVLLSLVNVVPPDISFVEKLRNEQGSDIYLCGGSIFAGWLLNHHLIDEVKIKLSHIIFGDGLPLFSGAVDKVKLTLTDVKQHDYGMLINTYKVKY